AGPASRPAAATDGRRRAKPPPSCRYTPPLSTRPASSSPQCSCEVIETHRHAQEQPADDEPGRRAEPRVESVADSTQQENRSQQGITGGCGGRGTLDVGLERLQRARQKRCTVVI